MQNKDNTIVNMEDRLPKIEKIFRDVDSLINEEMFELSIKKEKGGVKHND